MYQITVKSERRAARRAPWRFTPALKGATVRDGGSSARTGNAMTDLEPHYFETYRCSFLVQDVRITGYQELKKENGKEEVVREITGCSGARICGKFPQQSIWFSKQSVGCPYHDALLKIAQRDRR
ncbi:MAG TPA: hypothetical protein VKS60_15570 [Stellaceae bacterium]|nr:hypothetical protein [Stellaceae bacterium]